MKIKPFFINSNICLNEDDISTYDKFMKAIAGNVGNSYITYSLIKELFAGLVKIDHIPNIYEYDFNNTDKDVDYINNNCTHVFLVLQDLIRVRESYGLKLPYNNIMNFVKKLNKPVIVTGLGANSFEGFDKNLHLKLDSELIKFLKFLSDYCIEIGVRGNYTKEILSNLKINNVAAIGCPSFYEMGRNRILKKQDITDHRYILLSSQQHRKLKLHTIAQDHQEEKIIKAIAFNTIEDKIPGAQLKLYYPKMYHVFSDIESWKQFVSNFRFVIGGRLHGTILALNSGVVALCINTDSRTAEMCNLLKIPYKPTNIKIRKISDILKIYDSIDISEMNNNYTKLFDNFADFMHKNNLLLYFENEDKNQHEYINQPSLNLYDDDFYTVLENSPYVSKYKCLFFKMLNKIDLIKANNTKIFAAERERERESNSSI